MNYTDYILKIGDKEIGIDINDIENELLTPKEWARFYEFIYGQTMMGFKGISIVFTVDFERFINGKKVID